MDEQRWNQLNQQLRRLYNEGRWEEAVIVAQQASELALSLYQDDHPDVATSLNNLAGLYLNQGHYEKAEPLYEEALAMTQRLFRGDHPDVATSLNNLALLYLNQGHYEKIEPLFEEALTMRQRLFRGDHPDVATSLNNLALLYLNQAHYEKAEPLFEEALTMRQRLFKGDHPNVATSLNNLAGLYRDQGHYEKAKPLYEEALTMRRSLFKGNHPDVAISLNNLAGLYKNQGHYEKAEPLLEEALAMRQSLFKGDHPDVATSLNNLALRYNNQRHYEKAEPLLEEALEMRQRLFKGDHPDVATSLHNLALLYKDQGHYEKAEPLLGEALAMTQRLFKGDHPNIATNLNNLAGLYRDQGHYDKAEPLFKEALEMRQRLFKGDHPSVAHSLNNLAVLLAATNRPIEALKVLQEAIEVEDMMLRRVFAASSERDRLAYLQTVRGSFDRLLSLVWRYFSTSDTSVQATLDIVLKRKSLTASALAAFNYALYSGRYPHLTNEFQKLRFLGDKIVNLTFSPPRLTLESNKEEFQSHRIIHRQRLSELEAEWERLEKQLASQIPELQLQEQPSDCQAVAMRLPESSALVEFVQFDVFDFTALLGEKRQSSRYIAFVLPVQQPQAVQMIDLGEAKQIERLIHAFRQESAKPGNLLGARTKRTTETDSQPNQNIGIELRQKIYDPIHNAVSEYKHLFVAPDGELNLLPLQILPLKETVKERLLDKYTITYLSVGRDILRRQTETNRSNSEPLVIADPDFNLGAKQENQGQSQEQVEKLSETVTSVGSLLSKLDSKHFQRVEGTRILGEGVARRLGVKPYLQAEALESHVTRKDKECPRILLIATHGHFTTTNERKLERSQERLEILQQLLYSLIRQEDVQKLIYHVIEQEEEILYSNRAHVERGLLTLEENKEKVGIWLEENKYLDEAGKLRCRPQFAKTIQEVSLYLQRPNRLSAKIENPMLRSGLALAGANTWLAGDGLPKGAGKGFLFAQDITNLDLWANEITVLVACRSGIGDLRVGEGVFGLRRAFAVAGVKTLIMSLWDVPEKVSVLLMEHFFDNLESGRSRAEALQAAQNYVRSISVRELRQFPLGLEILQEWLEGVKKDVSQVDEEDRPLEYPFYWGAWICQGITTPLPYSS